MLVLPLLSRCIPKLKVDLEVSLSCPISTFPCVHLNQTTEQTSELGYIYFELKIILVCVHLNIPSITYHSLFPEVDAHCCCELVVKLVVGVPVEVGGLSHP